MVYAENIFEEYNVYFQGIQVVFTANTSYALKFFM